MEVIDLTPLITVVLVVCELGSKHVTITRSIYRAKLKHLQ